MSQIQSYYDLYELFAQIKSRYNLQSHLDWIGQSIDNYKFLNLSQQYISQDYWKNNIKTIISQYSSEIQTFVKSIKLKITQNDFDPHNQISGFSQISTIINWVNAKNSNGLIQLSNSFRIIETVIGKDTMNLICCTTNIKNIAICFIPIVPEIESFLSNYNFNLSTIKYFDLMQIIQILKTYIKRNQSTKSLKSIKSFNIKPYELTSINAESCLNHLKTQFSGSPFEIVNVQQTNTISLNSDGLYINQPVPNIKDQKSDLPIVSANTNTNTNDQSTYNLGDKYIMWIEDISLINNIIMACYIKS